MAKSQSTNMLMGQLKNPFPTNLVKWRVGATNKDKTKGIALAYIDARDVAKRLDDVVGIDGWQKKLIKSGDGFICSIGIKIKDEWIWKDDGAGDTAVEPYKGGASDAFKRAASVWGVGRYLYYLKNTWVDIKQSGRTYTLAELPELPDWARVKSFREDWEDIAEMEQMSDQEIDNYVDTKVYAQDNEGNDIEKLVKADESTKSSIIKAKKAQNESRA